MIFFYTGSFCFSKKLKALGGFNGRNKLRFSIILFEQLLDYGMSIFEIENNYISPFMFI